MCVRAYKDIFLLLLLTIITLITLANVILVKRHNFNFRAQRLSLVSTLSVRLSACRQAELEWL